MPDGQTFTDVQPIAQSFSDVQEIAPKRPSWWRPKQTPLPPGGKVTISDKLLGKANFIKRGDELFTQGIKDVTGGEYSRGAHELISGAGTALMPLGGGSITTLARAAAGGIAGQYIGKKGAAALGATEDQQALASDIFGIAGGVAVVKSPEILEAAKGPMKAITRKVGNPYGVASTGEELLTQGISPYAKATGFKAALSKAGADIKAYDYQNPIKGVQDLNDAIPEIKQKIWRQEVEPALNRQAAKPVDMTPVAKAVRAQITPEMAEFDEGNAAKLDALAGKLENARDVKSANSLLRYVNGQLESYFAKYPSARKANLMNNPETAGWEAARQSLREQFLSTLEDAGEIGVRDARLRYGALEEIGKQVERRVNVADRAKPMSIHRILGLAGALPTGGMSVAAGELGNYLNKPDVLIRRGISRLPTTKTITIGKLSKP